MMVKVLKVLNSEWCSLSDFISVHISELSCAGRHLGPQVSSLTALSSPRPAMARSSVLSLVTLGPILSESLRDLFRGSLEFFKDL